MFPRANKLRTDPRVRAIILAGKAPGNYMSLNDEKPCNTVHPLNVLVCVDRCVHNISDPLKTLGKIGDEHICIYYIYFICIIYVYIYLTCVCLCMHVHVYNI